MRMANFVKNGDSVLDIATGTADVLVSILKKKNVSMAVGVDRSWNMIQIGKAKVRSEVSFIIADGMGLPFKKESFDSVTVAFGIRNMADPELCLKEILRVLKSGGKVIVLEFSIPKNSVIRFIYMFYLRYVLPFLGKVLSGDRYAYKYLNRTIETFPWGSGFLKLMRKAGFSKTVFFPMTFGICTIYVGKK
jgi:demethylmenaquinone methyltransferase/2-methoxy-6-polyprenyl-1,4-benzoquinol methylase